MVFNEKKKRIIRWFPMGGVVFGKEKILGYLKIEVQESYI